MTQNGTTTVFDGHNDVLLRLREKGGSFFERRKEGHLDLPRAREGGFAGGFFAIFVPSERTPADPVPERLPERTFTAPSLDEAQRVVKEMMASLFEIEAASDGQVRVIRTAGEIERAVDAGTLAALMHIEGAEAIDTEFQSLEAYWKAGLRSLGIVWSRSNAFGHGVPFRVSHPDTGPGLTDAGKQLVRACNQLGVMIDLSHLNEQGFWDVAGISEAPLVATHSNAHALCATSRNLTDKQLDAIRESDGMVGINFATYFLRAGSPPEETPMQAIVDHIRYLADRIGIDRVGFGSDFDGARVPTELRDVAGLGRLVAALRRAGFDEDAVQKVTHRNWIRVLRKTWGG